MTDQTKAPTIQHQLDKERSRTDVLQRQVNAMLKTGGFADSKALSVRSTRIEDRVESLVRDNKLLLDVIGLQMVLLEDHLKDRHDADLVADNSIDVISFRKIKRVLKVWTEACGLTRRGRSDVSEARRDENRLRPRDQAST